MRELRQNNSRNIEKITGIEVDFWGTKAKANINGSLKHKGVVIVTVDIQGSVVDDTYNGEYKNSGIV